MSAHHDTKTSGAAVRAALGARARADGARRLLRPLRPVRNGASADGAEETLAELALLREENARLKAAPYQRPSFNGVVDETRALTAAAAADGDDEAADMLVRMIVLRDSLLEVCEELERSLALVREKLAQVGAEAGKVRDERRG
jgi:hypothetical protein